MHQCFNIIQKNNQKLQTEAWETCSSFKSMPCTFSQSKNGVFTSVKKSAFQKIIYMSKPHRTHSSHRPSRHTEPSQWQLPTRAQGAALTLYHCEFVVPNYKGRASPQQPKHSNTMNTKVRLYLQATATMVLQISTGLAEKALWDVNLPFYIPSLIEVSNKSTHILRAVFSSLHIKKKYFLYVFH